MTGRHNAEQGHQGSRQGGRCIPDERQFHEAFLKQNVDNYQKNAAGHEKEAGQKKSRMDFAKDWK